MTSDADATPALEFLGVVKSYGALRPLRLRSLSMPRGTAVAILGIDAAGAEMVVNLVTGSTLPDEGEVRVFGRSTASIEDADAWLTSLDRFGILSDRAVLLDELTAAQNLAMTLTLDVEALDRRTRTHVETIADEAGIPRDALDARIATLDAATRARVRLGRAVALGPELLLMEHPTASLQPPEADAFADVVRRLLAARGTTALFVTADARFASAVTDDVRTLKPATGELVRRRRGLRLAWPWRR